MWSSIARAITAATGQAFTIDTRSRLGGGCINAAYRITGCGTTYFAKVNTAERAGMFAAEAAALDEIAQTRTVRVPAVICHGADHRSSWLVLEHLALVGQGDYAAFGRRLAALHRNTASAFGWWRDNTIGATAQRNTQTSDWVAFWRDHRLGYQLEVAARNGYGGRLQREGERLMAKLPAYFRDHQPLPALLHGDLWSGNIAYAADGQPVIFDPATYYGDRESDIAMTELFGRLPAAFYAAYDASHPLAPGYTVRRALYNVYHLLNHLNLFGSGYLGQVEHTIGRLNALA